MTLVVILCIVVLDTDAPILMWIRIISKVVDPGCYLGRGDGNNGALVYSVSHV